MFWGFFLSERRRLQADSEQNIAFVLWKGRILKQLHIASASRCAEGTEQQASGTVLLQLERGISDTQKTYLVCLGI